ncbi:MAG: type II toxin-antitoxin system VapB family antitoxin [Ectothiorhodospiraceae bacterium]|nr:type II toxin-antitoxin system VapB family antitoxin [Ectothiorhodospiraceae bacterium]
MPEPQLSVRSARARQLAHELAKRERRTVAEIVERALEEYAAHQTGRVPAAEFYTELNRRFATNLDLEEVLRAERRAHAGVDL